MSSPSRFLTLAKSVVSGAQTDPNDFESIKSKLLSISLSENIKSIAFALLLDETEEKIAESSPGDLLLKIFAEFSGDSRGDAQSSDSKLSSSQIIDEEHEFIVIDENYL